MTKSKKVNIFDKISVTQIPIEYLNPAIYNPRKHSEKQLKNLMESISKYGLVDPIIVNGSDERKNIVIGGHFRLEAAKGLKFETVPVIYLNIPEIEKEKELNLRLNQNTGEWDYEILKEFDMSMLLDIGFDNAELSGIWDNILETEEDDFDIEKELENIDEPKSKIGEIYRLGKHFLMCGDSTNNEDVKKLVSCIENNNDKISMLYFDPPYNIGLDYNRGVSNGKKYGGNKTNDSKSVEDYSKFITSAISNGLEFAGENAHVFCYCDSNHIGLIQRIYSDLSLIPKRVCMWIKNNINATPNVAFNKVYEPCVYGVKGKPYLATKENSMNELLNKDIKSGNQALDDILDLLDIWLVKRLPVQDYEHPTSKPPTLHEKPLKRCTKTNDIVLDLFGGSGSTLIACEQLGRRTLLMEHEPIFIDLIIKRYEKLTGTSAIKIG